MERLTTDYLRKLSWSESSALVDAFRAESRAENIRNVEADNGWAALRENATLLGLQASGGSRPRMVFGSRH